ncbi:MAG: helix-turn-helix transcriptional regulator [Gammaproteobacteria bacterium]|nr:helix-turn-helix transcriptional regulator [Gammaproteobacteria bacterium]
MSNSSIDVFMNVKQVSGYLHLNEKKIYDMVNRGVIPATRVTGKWMFPKELIDKWMLDSTHNGLLRDRLIIAGDDDPLLYRLINDYSVSLGNKAIITYSNATTRTGLELLNANRADVSCLHWGPAQESTIRHPSLLQQYPASHNWVLIHAFQREQGLVIKSSLQGHTTSTLDLFDTQYRWDTRQGGSGSQRFLLEVLSQHGLNLDMLNTTSKSHSDREAAAAINLQQCDIAIATRATAREFGLEFVSLGWEQFDFVIPRNIWFRHLFHNLIEKIGSEEGQQMANELGGYRIENCGKLLWGDE